MTARQGGDGTTATIRTVVFIDYQNLYRGAREAFGYTGQLGHYGNFRPISLGRVLTRASERELTQVRVYTGVPTPRRDRKGNSIMQRRIAAWVADSPEKVEVFPRPLRYPPNQGREKGVDVELAIDVVRLAIDGTYDVGVVASADTDLVPALAFVVHRCEGTAIDTATWAPEPACEVETAPPVDIPGGGVTRVAVPKGDFDRVAERRNFVQDKSDPASVIGQSRWDKIKGRLSN